MIALILIVGGLIAALAGTLLTDTYERGTREYAITRTIAIVGVIVFTLAMITSIAQGIINPDRKYCESHGGLWLQSELVCLNIDQIPTIENEE